MFQAWEPLGTPADVFRRIRAIEPRGLLLHIGNREAAQEALPLLDALHRRWPRLPVVVCSPDEGDHSVERLVRSAGAQVYLPGVMSPILTDHDWVGWLLFAVGPTSAEARRVADVRATGPPTT